MNEAQAARFAALALGCLEREFPWQPSHVVHAPDDWQRPRLLHPAFHGCYDWHSAVHSLWLLVHTLRRFPAASQAGALRALLSRRLSIQSVAVEVSYLEANPAFERPYGWSWALKLAHELALFDDAAGRQWRAALAPLAEAIERLYLGWLPRQTYPVRTGVHGNTAFGLAFALDYARACGRASLAGAIEQRALDYFGNDRDYPAAWEPGGNDFLSPCLVEADLMRRVLPDFPAWFAAFLPRLPRSLLEPARVNDRGDGQLAHLDGLNLSRAWCFYCLGLREDAERHLQAGLKGLSSGHYEGEHWLASFAAYALACA
jgi:hypothetical protein